jgi:hypothetical protein
MIEHCTHSFTRLASKEWFDNPQDLLAKISHPSIENSGELFDRFT